MTARWMFATWLLTLPAASIAAPCPCDCSGDGTVSISELITAINVALGSAPVSQCSNFPDCEGDVCVLIVSLVQCVNAALSGCPAEPTPTIVPGSAGSPAVTRSTTPAIASRPQPGVTVFLIAASPLFADLLAQCTDS